jgi:FkbM family methyltransferase
VIAFEPQPVYADFIRRALPGVQVMQYAISDTESEAILHVPDDIADGGMAYLGSTDRRAVQFPPRIPVRTITVDSLGIKDVGFIKIDVEGLELAVLRGARDVIARDLPNLLIEAEDRHRNNAVSSVYEFLRPMGYEGWFLMDGALHAVEEFDVGLHQSAEALTARLGGAVKGKSVYVNNFIFAQPDATPTLRDALA